MMSVTGLSGNQAITTAAYMMNRPPQKGRDQRNFRNFAIRPGFSGSGGGVLTIVPSVAFAVLDAVTVAELGNPHATDVQRARDFRRVRRGMQIVDHDRHLPAHPEIPRPA